MRWQRWLVVAAIPAVMLVCLLLLRQSQKEDARSTGPQMGPVQKGMPGPAPEQAIAVIPRELDLAGISNPRFLDAADVDLAASEAVVGLIVAGEPRAYLQEALAGVPKKHVVSDHTQAGRITVTQCDLAKCTRVFVERDNDKSRSIRIGGLQQDQTLSLLIDGQRYSLRDQHIPLEEFPFTETSWGEWLASYPETKVYLGDRTGA